MNEQVTKGVETTSAAVAVNEIADVTDVRCDLLTSFKCVTGIYLNLIIYDVLRNAVIMSIQRAK